jgi:hypothetical protein
LALKDLTTGKDDWKRFEEFNEIPYNSMVFKFWKPVKSFYKNHKCLQED